MVSSEVMSQSTVMVYDGVYIKAFQNTQLKLQCIVLISKQINKFLRQ